MVGGGACGRGPLWAAVVAPQASGERRLAFSRGLKRRTWNLDSSGGLIRLATLADVQGRCPRDNSFVSLGTLV